MDEGAEEGDAGRRRSALVFSAERTRGDQVKRVIMGDWESSGQRERIFLLPKTLRGELRLYAGEADI